MEETPFEFKITVVIDGEEEQHSYSVAASTLPRALDQSMIDITRQEPKAQFKGLTYFYCPGPDDRPTFPC